MRFVSENTAPQTLDAELNELPSRAALRNELRQDLEGIVAGLAPAMFHFQPIADLRRNSVAGYEALVRLPVRSGLTPDLCLRVAAELGLEVPLESLLTRQALSARIFLPRNTFLSINVSPAFLCSSEWQEVLSEQDDLSRIVIEITEGVSIDDYDSIRMRVAEIVAHGGMIAVDDAGAGYASLKHILELKPNFIKLDRALIKNCDRDRAKSTMIEVLGAAADRMDAWVITEGVETAQELGELVRLNVPLAQGYFLGRPVPAMGGLSAEAQQSLSSFAMHREAQETLYMHAQQCLPANTRAQAQTLLTEDAPLVAVVDRWGRPTELLERHDVLGTRTLTGFMRCHASCDLREALRRALTRDAANRFDPIVLTDEEGRLQGAVRLDLLMLAALGYPRDHSH